MNFHEMSAQEKIMFLLEQHNNPRRDSSYAIMATPQNLLGSLALKLKGTDRGPRMKDEEILPYIKGMYCTFLRTGGLNAYIGMLRQRKCGKSTFSVCKVENFVNFKGRQVPNSEVKFFTKLEDAIKEFHR